MAIIQVKSLLDNRPISDDRIKESLYYYDFDIERTATYLREKYDKQNKPKVSAQDSAKKHPSKYNLLSPNQSLNKDDTGMPKMSKLMALAKSKSVESEQTGGEPGALSPKLSKLAALAKQKSNGPSGLSGPSALSASATSNKTSAPLTSLSILDKISNRSSPVPPSAARPLAFKSVSKVSKPTPPSPPHPKRIKAFPSINFQISFDIDLQAPCSPVGSLFRASSQPSLSSKITNTLYLPDNKEKIRAAFNNPSPDDIVLQAQEAGFSKVEQGVRKLKISNTSFPSPVKNVKKLDIEKEVASSPRKRKVNFVVIGHVDAGKSTLMGRLLYDCGAIDKHTIDKYKKESGQIGKASFALAWVFDQTDEERKRGVTIDIAISTFETKGSTLTIVDAPGHRDFVPNMIAGSSQADLAVLVVDASTDAFESGFDLHGQTKEHAILVRSLGVDRIIVAINKLETLHWSQARFDEIRVQLTEFLSKIGFSVQQVCFIPISGLLGNNVAKRNVVPELSWYNGPTLLEQLEASSGTTKDAEFKKNLRMIVADVYSGKHTSDVAVQGRIGSGSVQVGETVSIAPSLVNGLVKSLTVNGESKEWAISGDNVTLSMTNATLDDIRVGDVVSNLESPVPSSGTLISRIIIFELSRPLLHGTKVVIHRGRTNEPAKITKIIATLDKANGQVLKKKPRHLTSGQAAIVEIQLEDDMKIPVELFELNKELGRFILRKDGCTIAAGVVDKIL